MEQIVAIFAQKKNSFEPVEDNILQVYEVMNSKYNVGSYEEFKQRLTDPENRKQVFDEIAKDYDIGSYSDFDQHLGLGISGVERIYKTAEREAASMLQGALWTLKQGLRPFEAITPGKDVYGDALQKSIEWIERAKEPYRTPTPVTTREKAEEFVAGFIPDIPAIALTAAAATPLVTGSAIAKELATKTVLTKAEQQLLKRELLKTALRKEAVTGAMYSQLQPAEDIQQRAINTLENMAAWPIMYGIGKGVGKAWEGTIGRLIQKAKSLPREQAINIVDELERMAETPPKNEAEFNELISKLEGIEKRTYQETPLISAKTIPGEYIQTGEGIRYYETEGGIPILGGRKQPEPEGLIVKQRVGEPRTFTREEFDALVTPPKKVEEVTPPREEIVTESLQKKAAQIAKEPWKNSDLATSPNISIYRITAKKQPDGKWKLFYQGTRNEVFVGETFNSSAEARNFFKVQQAKAKQAMKEKADSGQFTAIAPVGAVTGFEKDEEGKWRYNVSKGLAGAAAFSIVGLAAAQKGTAADLAEKLINEARKIGRNEFDRILSKRGYDVKNLTRGQAATLLEDIRLVAKDPMTKPLIEKQTGEVIEEISGREVKKELITPKDVSIYNANIPLETSQFNHNVHDKVVEAFGNVMREKGLKWNKLAFEDLSDQFVDYFLKKEITFKDVAKYGVTENEFVGLWRENVTTYAKGLAKLSTESRKLEQVLDEMGTLIDEPTKDIYWTDKLYDIIKRVDNIRRGLMVSQLSTAMRNAFTQAGNIVVNSFDKVLETAIGKTGKFKEYDVSRFEQAFDTIINLSKRKQNKQIVEQILLKAPKEYDRLFSVYSSDVMEGTKIGKVLGNAEKAVSLLNIANKFQEYAIRNAAFVGKLQELLDKKGINLVELFEKNKATIKSMQDKYGENWLESADVTELKGLKDSLDQVTKQDIEKSVNYALDITFATQPKYGTVGYHFLKIINKLPMLPVGTGGLPFGRFLVNAMKWNFQHSPLGIASLLNPKNSAPEVISKATIGSLLLGAAWQLRNSDYAGTQWYEIKIGDRTIDIRAYNPFAAYLFVADIAKRFREGTLGRMTTSDWLKGIASSNLRAGVGLYTVDQLAASLGNADKIGKVVNTLKAYGGELVGGFFTPLNMINDFLAQFDESARIVRSTREEPFLGPIKSKIPLIRETLPERPSPTRTEPLKASEPLIKMFTGVIVRDKENLIESELHRLDFKPNEIYPRTGDAKMDRLVVEQMGKLADKILLPLLRSTAYKSWGDAVKAENIREKLAELRKHAINKLKRSNKEYRHFFELKKEERIPVRKRKALEELRGKR